MNANEYEFRPKRVCCGILHIAAVLSIVSLCGCFSPGGRAPEWVNNPKTIYPEAEYLVSVGEGDSRRAAENAAAANLSRIFEAHIESDERLLDTARETQDTFERTTDYSADINILSAQTLYNIQHAEAWTDDMGRVHAVAYLDRRETAAIYRDKIDRETAHVRFLRAQADQSVDLLTKFAHLRAAARHAGEARYLLRQLNVIHPPSVPGTAPGYTESQIRRDLAETAKQIRVEINIEGDTDGRMVSVLEALITGYGFVIGTSPVLKIEGHVAVNDTGQRTADLVFVRYELVVQIRDASGTMLVAVNEKGREGHVSLNEARVRSYRTLENAIDSRGTNRLDAYFDALVDHLTQ